MEIKILFFAQLRELFGTSESAVTVAAGVTVEEAVAEIIKGKENSGIDWKRIKYAVNEEFSEMSQVLQDQDTLVLLPPVSGG